MLWRFAYRRYRLPFRFPVRTGLGEWREREGLIVRLEDSNGAAGYGEAAAMPLFGTETVDEAEAACRTVGNSIDQNRIAAMPAKLRCLRHALAAAAAEPSHLPPPTSLLPMAALLPAGRPALDAAKPKAEAGFRIFKWKVGVDDIANELGLLDELCAILPAGSKLRIDANGAWDRRRAEKWMDRCAERPVEWVEQPTFAGASAGGARRQEVDDLLLGLANDYPTPLALDESLAGEGDVDRWLEAGWPGVFVVKPSLFGDVAGVLARLSRAKAIVCFSSAFETSVGARTSLRSAFEWPGEARALGFGVWPLFADARFDGPVAAPFLRWEEVERINPEAVWNALS